MGRLSCGGARDVGADAISPLAEVALALTRSTMARRAWAELPSAGLGEMSRYPGCGARSHGAGQRPQAICEPAFADTIHYEAD